jgi:ABC-type sugar transport system ATPase subunit
VLDFARERRVAKRYVDELAIRVSSIDRLAETLSGGNQQKLVLARWLCSNARILVLDDPTRGIDVGAKEEVFRLIRRLAAEGVAILYLASEIKEARALADRVLVMANGRIVRSFPPGTPEEEIMAAAGGVHG